MRTIAFSGRSLRNITLAAILCGLSLSVAHAQSLTFSLSPATQSALPGDTLTFQGTIANTGTTTVYLNGLAFNYDDTVNPSSTYLSDTGFDASVPVSLSAGASYTGGIFGITVSSEANASPLTGNVTVLGGSTASSFTSLNNTNFTVTVPVVAPEAGTLPLTLVGLVGGSLYIVRRRRS